MLPPSPCARSRSAGALPTSVTAETAPAPTQSVTLRIGTGTDDSATPLLYASKAGLFKKARLDVQIVKMNSGAAVAAAVAGGSLEIGKSSLLNLIVARSKGIPFALVAPGGLYVSDKPMGGMIVAVDSPIHTATDLGGKTVQSSALRDINTLATRAWVDAHGGDSSTLRFVEMAPLNAVGAVEQGRIDAATLVTPMYTEALASPKARVAMPIFDGIASRYLITGWFADEAFVRANRDAVARFADAMHDAEAYCSAHPDAARALIEEFTGLDAGLVAKMPSTVYPAALDQRDIQPIIDVAARYKVLDKAFDAREMISPAVVKATVH